LANSCRTECPMGSYNAHPDLYYFRKSPRSNPRSEYEVYPTLCVLQALIHYILCLFPFFIYFYLYKYLKNLWINRPITYCYWATFNCWLTSWKWSQGWP